jgi:preprotein translocase subunit SecG
MMVFNFIIHSSQSSQSKNSSKLISILLAVIAGFFLVATIVLAVLYSMERNKNRFNQTEQGTYYPIVSGEDN